MNYVKRQHNGRSPSVTFITFVVSLVFLVTETSLASHFRFGHLSWRPKPSVSPTTVEFTLINAFRRDAYRGSSVDGYAAIGDTINESLGGTILSFGDGTQTSTLRYLVIAVDPLENWILAQALNPGSSGQVTIEHTYPSASQGGNPWVAEINTCCRNGVEINNANGFYRVFTLVETASGNSSPSSSLPAIINLPQSPLASFYISATDPDPVTKLIFRLANPSEAGNASFLQPSAGGHALVIDSLTGRITWNTLSAQINGLYSCQVIIEDRDAVTNARKTQVAIDFLIRIVSCPITNSGPSLTVSNLFCGSNLMGVVGVPMTFVARADDADTLDTITLNAVGLPIGSITTPTLPVDGNPVNALFTWTPTMEDLGPHLLIFSGTDKCGAQEFCALTITIVEPVQVNISSESRMGQSIELSVTAPAGYQPVGGWIYYREGGHWNFDSVAMVVAGASMRGEIPGSSLTMRGMEYYLAVEGPVALTYPLRDPKSRPATIRVSVPTATTTQTLRPRRYRMVSAPVDLLDPDVIDIFTQNYGPYDPMNWRLFHWQNDDYVEYKDSITGMLIPGKSYWLATHSGQAFSIHNGLSVESAYPYAIELAPGWNQIANPFAFPVAWDSIMHSQLVKGPYLYENTEYRPGVKVLQPWEGYFVNNDSSEVITLEIAPKEAPAGLQKTADLSLVRGERDYILQLSAVAGEWTDSYNYIGFKEQSLMGNDRHDLPKPPPIGDYVQLSIVEGDEDYQANFKPMDHEGQAWEFVLSSTQANKRAEVRLTSSGNLREGFAVYVLDLDDYAAVPTAENTFSVQLKDRLRARSFRVIIGTQPYAEQHSGGIPLIPLQYELEQNYPNPFNPTTTITYQLSKRSEVILEIYNILGQRIKTLVNEVQLTGRYAVEWDGRNNAGNLVGSGVYLYRLSAGGYVATRRLVFVR